MTASTFHNCRQTLPARLSGPVCVAAIVFLAGCEDPSADLQLQAAHAKAELDEAKAEIQELRAEAGRQKEQPAAAATVRPAASEEGFRDAAKDFAGQLEAELKGATVYSPAYSEVKTVAKFFFDLRMPDGSSSRLDVDAAATPDGRWNFPAAGEAARRILAAASAVPANPAQTAQPPPQVQPQQVRQPAANPGGPGIAADETKNVNWGDKPRQPGAARNPAGQPLPPPVPPPIAPSIAKPAPPRAPNPALPKANEEQNVSFERKK